RGREQRGRARRLVVGGGQWRQVLDVDGLRPCCSCKQRQHREGTDHATLRPLARPAPASAGSYMHSTNVMSSSATVPWPCVSIARTIVSRSRTSPPSSASDWPCSTPRSR